MVNVLKLIKENGIWFVKTELKSSYKKTLFVEDFFKLSMFFN